MLPELVIIINDDQVVPDITQPSTLQAEYWVIKHRGEYYTIDQALVLYLNNSEQFKDEGERIGFLEILAGLAEQGYNLGLAFNHK